MDDSNPPAISHSLETIYRALESRRRRLILYHLRGTSDGVSGFDSVKDRISDWEDDFGNGPPRSESERELAVTLHHVHLPQLEDCGIIDYDWRTKTIRYRTDDLLEAHLELAAECDFDE